MGNAWKGVALGCRVPRGPGTSPVTKYRRKEGLSGILLGGRPQEGWTVLGIVLNVRTREFPEDLRETATSLALQGVETTVDAVLAALIERLERWAHAPAAGVLEAWRERDALRGRQVAWASGEGTAAGVDETGALVVELAGGGTTTLDAGEVHLRL